MARLAVVMFAVLLIGACGEEITEAPSSSSSAPISTSSASSSSSTSTEPSTTPESTSSTTTTAPSTTSKPTTTTEPSTTTSSTTTKPDTTTNPTTTTSAPPTPTPAPKKDEFFRVTENNVTCVMYGGDVNISISYENTAKKIMLTSVKVPQPGDEDVNAVGSCNVTDNGEQYISVMWGPTNKRSKFNLLFNSTGETWKLVHTQLNIYMDETVFVNATDAGKFLRILGEFPGLSNVAVDTNSSLVCRADIESKNFTGEVLSSKQKYTVTASAVGLKLQAFNSIAHSTALQQGKRCEADITSDLVPIAVGCALAGLVLLVLISYLVGRRRRSAAYQSV